MVPADVPPRERRHRRARAAGPDRHLPQPLQPGGSSVAGGLLLLPGEHLEERGLGDDADVAAARVHLLGLELLGALLARAVERRALVADHEVVKLRRHRVEVRPVGGRDLPLGLLAGHGRELAREHERRALQVDRRRGRLRLALRGRAGRRRLVLRRREVRGHERFDHDLHGEVVVPRLAAGDELHQPVEAEGRRREPPDVAHPPEHRIRERLVERQVSRPRLAAGPKRCHPRVGLPLRVVRQRLEELRRQRLHLQPALVHPAPHAAFRQRVDERALQELGVEGVEVELRQLFDREVGRALGRPRRGVLDAVDQAGEEPGPQLRGRVDLRQQGGGELERLVALGEQPVGEPRRRQLARAEVLADRGGGERVAPVGVQQRAPRVQADVLARVARAEQVGGELADGVVLANGELDETGHRQVAGVRAGVAGRVGGGPGAARLEQPQHRVVQPELRERGLLEPRHVAQHPDDELVDRRAARADEPGDPRRLDLAQHRAEVRLQARRRELAHAVRPRALQQVEERPRRPLPRLGERAVLRQALRGAVVARVVEPAAAVLAGLVVEDVVGDPRAGPVRPAALVVRVRRQHVARDVGVGGGQRLADPAQVPPRPAAQVPERVPADLVRPPGERRVEPRGQRTPHLRVPARLGLLEDPLQRPPRAVRELDGRDHLQQAPPGERAVVRPQREDHLVQAQAVRQRRLRRGRFERLELLDPVVGLLGPGFLVERLAADLGDEALERHRAFAGRRGGRGVRLGCELPDEPDHGRIPGGPGASHVVQIQRRRVCGHDTPGPSKAVRRGGRRGRRGRRCRRSRRAGNRMPAARWVSPGRPAHVDRASEPEGGGRVYFKTWDIEGSLDRRIPTPPTASGTAIGEVGPDRWPSGA
ncbi:MAG: hypothetical protein AVDCRST_MAG64-3436 [uncultured Phycisphaerae bacterium]|uniref:Uncharacterized protein n=1 Tax=uncultured Phycisphaerae bacterium TaxID=904963 RepID=A0A6J4PYY6_9BACT|nr:MAG: hypothetical protein AVDCRST_MAG64-3436 [uncultured Phycisphaerae bacterium]